MDGMIRLVNKWYLFDMYLFAKESSMVTSACLKALTIMCSKSSQKATCKAQRVLRSNGDESGDAKTLNLFEDFFGFGNLCQLCWCAKLLGDDFFQRV